MKKIVFLALAFVWLMGADLLAQTPALPSLPKPFGNVATASVNHPNCKGFWWVREDFTTFFAYIDSANSLRMVRPQLDAMMNIDDVVPSPDQQYILIFSSGEGHPFLCAYKIDDLMQDVASLPALSLVNPYPTWFGEVVWLDNQRVLFSSPTDFSKIDKESQMGAYTDDSPDRQWIWNILDGKIMEKK